MQRGYFVRLAAFLVFLAACGQCYGQTDAFAARSHAILQKLEAVTPSTVQQMPGSEALELFATSLEVVSAGIAVAGERNMTEEGFRRYLASQGIEKLFYSEEIREKLGLLYKKGVSAENYEAFNLELQRRSPAYADYMKRAMVSEALINLFGPKSAIADDYKEKGAIPSTFDPGILSSLRAQKAVRSANYENGRFRLVFDEKVQDGGVVEVSASPKGEGLLEWKCTASASMQSLVPGICR
jgi:hypothetical protein